MIRFLIIGLLIFAALLFIGNIGWGISLFISILVSFLITYFFKGDDNVK